MHRYLISAKTEQPASVKPHITSTAMSKKLEIQKQDLQTRSRQFKGRNYKIMKEFPLALALSALIDMDFLSDKTPNTCPKTKVQACCIMYVQSTHTSVY